ncbi:DUF4340 domain-containing protein [Allofournierella sp.]|uniref:DUF4340 domain-containing protein n=1 Tax=Allofournierella sp. TaxID=1940256 RepID=UPI003AB5CED9
MRAKEKLLLGLAALLAALALGVFAAGRLSGAESRSAGEESIPLADWPAADIERFGIEYAGETLTFVKAELPEGQAGSGAAADSDGAAEPESEWQLEGEPETALDQGAVSTMLTALAGLQADRALGAASEEYGLDTPTLRFWVTANGATHTFAVGDENGVTGSVYLQREGESEAYLVAASRVDSLKKTRGDLLAEPADTAGKEDVEPTPGQGENAPQSGQTAESAASEK